MLWSTLFRIIHKNTVSAHILLGFGRVSSEYNKNTESYVNHEEQKVALQ